MIWPDDNLPYQLLNAANIKVYAELFFSIIIMYIVLTNIWRNENKRRKKDHTNTAPYRFFINSKAIN